MSLISSFWDGFIEKLEINKKNNPVMYPLLKYAKPIELTDNKITLSVDSPGAQEFLEKRSKEIETAFFNHSKKRIEIKFLVKIPSKKSVTLPLLTFEPSIEDVFVNRKHNLCMRSNNVFDVIFIVQA